MSLTLYAGNFQPWLELECVRNLLRDLQQRKDPLREQSLMVVPTRLLRIRIHQLLAQEKPDTLFGFRIMTLDHLCMDVAMECQESLRTSTSSSLYFPFALYRLAQKTGNKRFTNFRICAALHQTLRDLTDGGISGELLDEALEFVHQDPEYSRTIDLDTLRAVAEMHQRMEHFTREAAILPRYAAALRAAPQLEDWLARRNIKNLHLYGFYDSTQTQYDVFENAVRSVIAVEGTVRFYFPLPVAGPSRVSHPATFAQQFYDRLNSLCAVLGGQVVHETRNDSFASAGVERLLFQEEPAAELLDHARSAHRIEIFNAAGVHDEAWAIAKKILDLVIHQGVQFDRILVVLRSAGEELVLLKHVFDENRIPISLIVRAPFPYPPSTRFALTLLRAREARMNAASLFELLSSPFLPGLAYRDFKNIRKLMEECSIHNWDDWGRLQAVLRDADTVPGFEREDEAGIRSLRGTAESMFRLKRILHTISEKDSLPHFAGSLAGVMETLCGPLQSVELAPVYETLKDLSRLSAFQDFSVSLPEFADLLKQHLESQEFPEPPDEAESRVIVGDIMQLRGYSADHVFLIGLNQDVFPRRTQEDPFLPDNTRNMLRALTGAGPALRKRDSAANQRLLPLKEGTGEELLLFYLALRTAGQRLYLSFRRTDEKGQNQSCSTYVDEVLRLLTGRTSPENSSVRVIPKHPVARFDSGAMPTPAECSLLSTVFSPDEIVRFRHDISASYAQQLRNDAIRLNARDLHPAEIIDGCIQDTARLWQAVMTRRSKSNGGEHLQLSYSRFKEYLQCPFRFFSREILQLHESPRDAGDAEHDLNALLKGRMAEDVLKGALRRMKEDGADIQSAVKAAAEKTAERYGQILPPLLLDVYLPQFHDAALSLLNYLQREGYRLADSSTPEREDMIEAPFMSAGATGPAMTLRGIPDLLLAQRNEPSCIGELKWGAWAVGKTPSLMFNQGEAQFCIYPELLKYSIGKHLPFRYFRLDAFHKYGAPDNLDREILRLKSPRSRIQTRTASRILGAEVLPRGHGNDEESQEYFFDKCRESGKSIQAGQFRIIRDPGIAFSVCGNCSFTQICRKSHTGTLLRARRASR